MASRSRAEPGCGRQIEREAQRPEQVRGENDARPAGAARARAGSAAGATGRAASCAAHLLFLASSSVRRASSRSTSSRSVSTPCDEFVGFGAARHVATFLLQILGDVLRERVVRAAREAERRARERCRPDVRRHRRSTRDSSSSRSGCACFSSSLNVCATSASPSMWTAPPRNAASGAGPASAQQRQRCAGKRRVGRAFVIGVERHVLAVRLEVHARAARRRRAGQHLGVEALAQRARRRRSGDVAIQQGFERRKRITTDSRGAGRRCRRSGCDSGNCSRPASCIMSTQRRAGRESDGSIRRDSDSWPRPSRRPCRATAARRTNSAS